MFRKILLRLRSTHRAALQPRTAVNQVQGGVVVRGDGVVMAWLPQGVLVEWQRGGASVVPPSHLTPVAG